MTAFRPGDRVRVCEPEPTDEHRDFATRRHPGVPVGSEGVVLEHAAATKRADGRDEAYLVEWNEIGASTFVGADDIELAHDDRPAVPAERPPSNASNA